MKLATFTADGSTRVGVVTGGHVVDLSQVAPELPADMLSLLEGGAQAMTAVRAAGEALGNRMPLETVRLEAPIRPRKYLLIGRNYRSYESKTVAAPGDEVAAARLSRTINHLVDLDNMKAAGHQIWTNKQTSAVTGPFETILIPRNSDQVMYENELGVVIGTRCRYVSRQDAPDVIAGYLICNDVTVTDWSWVSPTFMLGKSFDTHGPIGPWIVTPDEIGDPHALGMRVYVSGQLDQTGTTADMETDCYGLIEYLSQFMTLEPGDVLATGLPASPLRFLRDGDVVRCEIDGIGHIQNPVAKER